MTRLWTIQPIEVWEQLEAQRAALVDPDRMVPRGFVPWQYEWLVPQLQARSAAFTGRLPWWCYCEKPDLRTFRHSRAAGSRHVRLEFEPAPRAAIAFWTWAWCTIYCGGYLAPTRREELGWERRMRRAVPGSEDTWPLPEPWRSELETSWLRLFDGDLGPRRGRDRTRTAVIEELRTDDVRSVTFFTGTSEVLARALERMRARAAQSRRPGPALKQ